MSEFPLDWPRYRALAWDPESGAVCLWFASFEEAGRIYVYREYVTPYGQVPVEKSFAGTVCRLEKDAGERGHDGESEVIGYTHPSVWHEGGPGRMLANHGAYFREREGTEKPGMEKVASWLVRERLLQSDGTWEEGVRLMVHPQCRETDSVVRGRVQRPLIVRALVVAVMSRPPAETSIVDSPEERERQLMRRRRRALGLSEEDED